jgi:glutathione S-transferase
MPETLTLVSHVLCPYVQRARHRGWMEFGSSMLNTVAAFYAARDVAALQGQREQLLRRFGQLEAAVHTQGPWFAGDRFTLVDAVFAPVFRYFDTFEAVGEGGWLDATPRLRSWRAALAQRPSVREAVLPDYSQRLGKFLLARDSELSRRIADNRRGRHPVG